MKSDKEIFNDFCNEFFPEWSDFDKQWYRKSVEDLYHYHFYVLNVRGRELKEEFINALPKWLRKIIG